MIPTTLRTGHAHHSCLTTFLMPKNHPSACVRSVPSKSDCRTRPEDRIKHTRGDRETKIIECRATFPRIHLIVVLDDGRLCATSSIQIHRGYNTPILNVTDTYINNYRLCYMNGDEYNFCCASSAVVRSRESGMDKVPVAHRIIGFSPAFTVFVAFKRN